MSGRQESEIAVAFLSVDENAIVLHLAHIELRLYISVGSKSEFQQMHSHVGIVGLRSDVTLEQRAVVGSLQVDRIIEKRLYVKRLSVDINRIHHYRAL